MSLQVLHRLRTAWRHELKSTKKPSDLDGGVVGHKILFGNVFDIQLYAQWKLFTWSLRELPCRDGGRHRKQGKLARQNNPEN